jgi:hypothetical protein
MDANELLPESRSVGKSLPVDPEESSTTVYIEGAPFFLTRDSSGEKSFSLSFIFLKEDERLDGLPADSKIFCEDMNGAPPPGNKTKHASSLLGGLGSPPPPHMFFFDDVKK